TGSNAMFLARQGDTGKGCFVALWRMHAWADLRQDDRRRTQGYVADYAKWPPDFAAYLMTRKAA
ncbi:MAG: hypothetical protein ACE5M4_14160, partial [Anaerolineales bacterium]